MADSMLARPSFWQVPREFRDRSSSSSSQRHVVYDSQDPSSTTRGRSSDRQQQHNNMLATGDNIQQQQRTSSPCRLHQHQVQGLSSASDAGLQKGDIVFSVNGQPVQGQTLQSISDQVQRDASTTLTIGVSRPNSSLDRSRPLSPMSANSSPIPAGAVTQSQVNDLFRPLPRSPIPSSGVKRYDPASAQDQEKMMYEEERNHEVRAIKTTPYRSQAVVSPKPKVLHDHVQGSYLQMQHYPDAPTHGHMMNHVSPMPARRVMQEAQFQHYVQQVDPTAASIGPVAMQYNSPIGLYSQENAINTLRQTHGGHQASGNSSGHQVSHGPSSRLMPDNVVMEGSERKLNLAASPTFRMVQAMEQGAGKVHEPVQDRVYSPIPTYIPNETGNDPQQSASFKSLMNSLLSHPKV